MRFNSAVEPQIHSILTAAAPKMRKEGTNGGGDAHDHVPASIGTANYIDLNDPEIILPHDDAASISQFASAVKDAFVDAERCSVFRYQPDVSALAAVVYLQVSH